jgi:hypothetical protein
MLVVCSVGGKLLGRDFETLEEQLAVVLIVQNGSCFVLEGTSGRSGVRIATASRFGG